MRERELEECAVHVVYHVTIYWLVLLIIFSFFLHIIGFLSNRLLDAVRNGNYNMKIIVPVWNNTKWNMHVQCVSRSRSKIEKSGSIMNNICFGSQFTHNLIC